MDANKQLTINSFRQLFPDKIFLRDTSLTFSKIPDNCQIPWHFQVFQTGGHPGYTIGLILPIREQQSLRPETRDLPKVPHLFITFWTRYGIWMQDKNKTVPKLPTLPCGSSLVPSVLHLSHGFQCSPTLNHQPYEGRLPLTSWWRKSWNMTVGQSSLISLAHHCYKWHQGSHCGWTCNQLTSKVDEGITRSLLRWSTLTYSVRPHNPTTRFWPSSATVVPTETFSHGTGTLRCL